MNPISRGFASHGTSIRRARRPGLPTPATPRNGRTPGRRVQLCSPQGSAEMTVARGCSRSCGRPGPSARGPQPRRVRPLEPFVNTGGPVRGQSHGLPPRFCTRSRPHLIRVVTRVAKRVCARRSGYLVTTSSPRGRGPRVRRPGTPRPECPQRRRPELAPVVREPRALPVAAGPRDQAAARDVWSTGAAYGSAFECPQGVETADTHRTGGGCRVH